jgi:hypothetical protein
VYANLPAPRAAPATGFRLLHGPTASPDYAELTDGAVVLAEDETHLNLLPWAARPGSHRADRGGGLRNLIVHRSKLVKRWLAADRRLRVLHGARYSPTNPVEHVWGVLKAPLRLA